MNNEELIYKAFNALEKKNDTTTVENEYEPLEELKIARTIIPENRTSYNETWKHIYNQLRIEL